MFRVVGRVFSEDESFFENPALASLKRILKAERTKSKNHDMI